MLYVDLETMKKHLNIENDFTEDDSYISSLIEVSQDAIERHINTKLSDIAGSGDLPPALKHLIMFLAADYYANRETVSFASCVEIPHTFQYLIGLFRNYGDASGTT